MTGFVYRWTDSSNGMQYIGSHKGTPDDGYIGSGKWFMSAYTKRPKMFSREILYIGEDFRELEEFILTEIDAANNKEFYNLKNEAVGGNTFLGRKHTEESLRKMSKAQSGKTVSKETRQKISKTLTGRKASKETKQKLSAARQGDKNGFFGKQHSIETKAKISKANKGNYIGDERMSILWSANKKSVYCESLDSYFPSIKECALKLGISQSSVSNMMAGRVKNRYGVKII